jgi:EmrB/QacA subfamily drug resistance transporter
MSTHERAEPVYGSKVTDHPQLALAVIMTGVLIAAVDTTIVVLALPEIQRGLHVALSSIIWVVIGYLLTITLLATQVGKLGDLFGRVRMYEAGFVVFVIGSALCAISFDEASIIGFRVLQGIGGALISANSGAVIADIFPPERRGRAYGFNAVGWSLGAVLGIVLGGVIVTYVSWRWIFWINVPIGIAAVLLATRVLRNEESSRRHRFDILGMLSLGLGIFGVLWTVTQLATRSMNEQMWITLLGGLLLLAVFVVVELKHTEPMLNLHIFRIPTMSTSLFAATFQALGNYAVLFLLIMYLQGPRGLTPLDASLLLVPGYLLGGVMGPIAGRLADRVGPVIPATVGLAIQVVALIVYAHLGNDIGLGFVVLASVVNGIGGSMFFPSNNAAVMKASPPELFGVSSGILRTFSNIGMVFSFSVAILAAAKSIPRSLAFAIFVGTTKLSGHLADVFTHGIHGAFYTSAVFMVVAAMLSISRKRASGSRPKNQSVTPTSAS